MLLTNSTGAYGLTVSENMVAVTYALVRRLNVIITPHVGGNFHLPETFERVAAIAADNLRRFAAGQELTRQVNRETGY